LFEPIPTGAGGGSSAGSSHDVSTGLDSAVTHHCTRGASDGVESRWSAGKEEGSPRRRGWRHCVYRAGRFRDGGERSRERVGWPHAGTPKGSSCAARAAGLSSARRSRQRLETRRKRREGRRTTRRQAPTQRRRAHPPSAASWRLGRQATQAARSSGTPEARPPLDQETMPGMPRVGTPPEARPQLQSAPPTRKIRRAAPVSPTPRSRRCEPPTPWRATCPSRAETRTRESRRPGTGGSRASRCHR
jgi:hypothetical protein